MNIFVTLYSAILFFVLTPAVFLRLPPNGSKYTVAAVHAIVFAVVFHFTHKIVWRMSMGMEGFQEDGDCDMTTHKMVNGKCVPK